MSEFVELIPNISEQELNSATQIIRDRFQPSFFPWLANIEPLISNYFESFFMGLPKQELIFWSYLLSETKFKYTTISDETKCSIVNNKNYLNELFQMIIYTVYQESHGLSKSQFTFWTNVLSKALNNIVFSKEIVLILSELSQKEIDILLRLYEYQAQQNILHNNQIYSGREIYLLLEQNLIEVKETSTKAHQDLLSKPSLDCEIDFLSYSLHDYPMPEQIFQINPDYFALISNFFPLDSSAN